MLRIFIVLLSISTLASGQKINYPITQKETKTDIYPGGVAVEDPFAWLEDDNSLKTKVWVEQENKLTRNYLDTLPFRDSLRAKMTRNWNYVKYQPPFQVGDNYMYYRMEGLQNQPVLFYMKSLQYVPMAYFDPNKLSEDGTVAIKQTVPSHDGLHLAFVISKSGSDWSEVRIKETKNMKTLPEALGWVKFSEIAWWKDGFFYSRYATPHQGTELTASNENHKVYYHKLNTPQENDSLVYEDPAHPQRTYSAFVTTDEHYLVLLGEESTSGNSVYVCDLKKPGSKIKPLITEFENDFRLIGNVGTDLYFLTDNKADHKKIIKVNATTLKAPFSDLISEKSDILVGASMAGKYLAVHYMKDACSRLFLYGKDGLQKVEIPLPGLGTVENIHSTEKDSNLFFSFTSFTSPSVVYRFNLYTLRLAIQFKVPLPFEPNAYITEQVFYTSKDGVKIPMFLVHKKDYKPDGNTPVLIYGYGGFNISKTPEFKPERMAFLESGGLIAFPNLRGGGEYGRAWHQAGTREKKQNVFDDCIAAAEWLISKGYTNPSKLALQGRSNGGLLVGAVITQRPDLFKVALPAVGVMDMLKYQKFTIGWSWAHDYGTSDDSIGFKTLIKYSPLHNLKSSTAYPATLITTADHDDRVVPAHSFKFAARLQEVQTGDNPALIRIDNGAGHGAGKPTGKLIDEQVDIFSFLMYNLGMKL